MKRINFPKMDVKVEGLEEIKIPRMVKIRQLFNAQKIDDIAGTIKGQMETNLMNHGQYDGKRIAISVGSRGIPHLDVIVRTVSDTLRSWGAKPFIVPAMGSHGGGTADGQAEMIATYNITEESMGIPVRSSMEVVQLGTLEDGMPVYCDKNAYESDGIVILNKVKPHTNFRGAHESGMAKMMAIGLAKHKGASMLHMKGMPTFGKKIPQVCDVFMKQAPIAFGVGIVQNAYDDICQIEVMEKEHIMEKDAELLVLARDRMAKFKFNDIDVLIIDQIGKNISGYGHDPNITSQSCQEGLFTEPHVKKMFVRGLTKETHHNASGIASADITTRRCLNDIDFEATWVNMITSTMLNGARIPLYMENDYEALRIAIRTCTGDDFDLQHPKVVHIKDTMHMTDIEVSEAYLNELRIYPDIEILSEPFEMEFTEDGFMKDIE